MRRSERLQLKTVSEEHSSKRQLEMDNCIDEILLFLGSIGFQQSVEAVRKERQNVRVYKESTNAAGLRKKLEQKRQSETEGIETHCQSSGF